MPNHIKNKITLSGEQNEIDKLKSHMLGYPYDNKEDKCLFDFNKIIPMPKEMNITSDGWLMLLDNQFHWHTPLKNDLDDCRKRVNFEYNDQLEESIDNFAKAIKNYLKYGVCCWHDWAVKYWGTKWNSYSHTEWDNNSITFETAWSNVISLVETLSGMFPYIGINYAYSDEDTGYNCGYGLYKDGLQKFIKLENGSIEAYNLAFELRPDRKNDYILIDRKYEYKEDED